MEILDYLIRVRGGRQGKREADRAAEGFDNLTASISEADKAAGRFVDSQGRMREANGRYVAGANDGRKATKGFGGELQSLGSKLNNVSGRLQLLAAGVLFLGPSLISLAASASAAVTGAGIVGGAGLLALGVALGGVIMVGKSMVDQLSKVKDAQDAYNLAVAQYGPASDEATRARERFLAVVDQQGGERTLRLLEDLNKVTEEWARRTDPARRSLTRLFAAGLRGAKRLLPSFAGATNKGASAVASAGSAAARRLSGREMQGNITAFGNTGAAVIPRIANGLTDVFFALLRLLRPALPYVERAAAAFESWAHSLRAAAGDGPKLAGFVAVLVGHFKSWWALAKELARTIGILFSSSADSGKGLVDSLTENVDRFNDWLQAAKDSGQLRRYFDEAADAARGVAKGVWAFVTAVVAISAAIMPFLPMIGALAPLIGPLVAAFVGWKLVTMALAIWSKRLLVQIVLLRTFIILLRTMILIATAVQWAWNAAMLANPIGLVILAIVALVAAIVLVIKHWDWVKRAAGNALNWIKGAAQSVVQWFADNWGKILPLLAGPFGLLVKLIVQHFDGIKEAFRGALNWIIERWNGIEFTVPRVEVAGHNVLPGGGSKIGTPDIPLLAEGGNVRQRGSVIVGDAGPEVLDLPAGATVTPLDKAGAPSWPTGDIVLKVGRRELVRMTRDEIIAGMARG